MPKSSRISWLTLALFVALLVSCQKKVELLHPTADTYKDSKIIHIGYVQSSNENNRWQPNFADCFAHEPGVEFYNSTELFRLLRERNLPIEFLTVDRDLSRAKALSDFSSVLVSVPRAKGIMLKGFLFHQNKYKESFLAPTTNYCQDLYRWLGYYHIVSFPDNAFIFVNGEYVGQSPHWIQLKPGRHKIRLETYSQLLGEREITSPAKEHQMLFKAKDSRVHHRAPDDMTEGDGLSSKLSYIIIGLGSIAVSVLPIIFLL